MWLSPVSLPEGHIRPTTLREGHIRPTTLPEGRIRPATLARCAFTRQVWPGAFSHAGPLTLRDLLIELATAAARRRGGSALGRCVHVSPSRLLGAAYRHTLPPHNKACTPSERGPGMVAPGRCDAPIPRPHSPAPAGAEERELFPFAAWRHRSRSTPSRQPRPRRRWPALPTQRGRWAAGFRPTLAVMLSTRG